MPASAFAENKILEIFLKKTTYTATTTWLGLSKLTPTALTKVITGKEFGENEFKESEGWKRIEADNIEWEVTTGTGNEADTTHPTKYVNKNAITFEKITGAEELKLETFAITDGKEQLVASNIIFFGKLATPVTINKATTTFEIQAKKLEITLE